ncbi:hypothetical protein F4809DRAFT_640228 [Biscogniauxia mediterranea]|nr:hypothetical protein F4809DRAFT_640228 [Biscogniauxia mediterranea]
MADPFSSFTVVKHHDASLMFLFLVPPHTLADALRPKRSVQRLPALSEVVPALEMHRHRHVRADIPEQNSLAPRLPRPP